MTKEEKEAAYYLRHQIFAEELGWVPSCAMDDYYKSSIENDWMAGLLDQVAEEGGKHREPERNPSNFMMY